MFDGNNEDIDFAAEARRSIAADLKRTREALNLTQEDVAEAIGVTPRTVQRWENMESSVPTEKWMAFQAFCVMGYVTRKTEVDIEEDDTSIIPRGLRRFFSKKKDDDKGGDK